MRVVNQSTEPITVTSGSVTGPMAPGSVAELAEADYAKLPASSKGPGRIVPLRELAAGQPLEVVPAQPEAQQATASFEPMYFYTSAQGGRVGFSVGTEVVPIPDANPVPLLVVHNPSDSGVGVRNWRQTVSSSVPGTFRRVRGIPTPKSGATPLAPINRGGGSNQPKARGYRGVDVSLRDTVLVRSELIGGYRPYEVWVQGSIVVPPGRATQYEIAVSDADIKAAQKAGITPVATVEYVWWEEPWEA